MKQHRYLNKFIPVGLILLSIFYSCSTKQHYKEIDKIDLLKTIKLKVTEPSGLTFSEDLKTLWTVSDEDSSVSHLDLNGNILKSFKLNGFDLEGICSVNDSLLAVVFERTREVVIIDTSGNELKRFKLDIAGNDNQGLEGIEYDQENKHFYVIKEKNPCLLIEYDIDFGLIRKDTLKFSSDVSGLFYEASEKLLWVLSDENSCVNIIDLQRIVQQKLSFNLNQPEGIAFNPVEERLYIVSDLEEELYIFKVE